MIGVKLKLIAPMAVLLISCLSGYAQEVDEQICQSHINTFCLRCHSVQRICDGIGVKNDAQWQSTLKVMSEYGNLDKDIQEKVYECVSSQNAENFEICSGKNASTGRPRVITVSNVSDAGKSSPQAQGKIFRSIGPEEALRMMQARDDIIFLDVRTPSERSHGAIPGSKLVSIYALLKGEIPLPKDKPILLVCAVGGRSYVAAQALSKYGYREVYNLSGGVKGWYKAGLPLTYDKAAVTK